jgi:hypothetical protein
MTRNQTKLAAGIPPPEFLTFGYAMVESSALGTAMRDLIPLRIYLLLKRMHGKVTRWRKLLHNAQWTGLAD